MPSDNVDGRFLYYLLRHEAPRIAQMAGGAATPIINTARLLDQLPERRQPPKTVPPLRRPEVRARIAARESAAAG